MSQENAFPQAADNIGGEVISKPNDSGVPKNIKWAELYSRWVTTHYNFIMPRFSNNPLPTGVLPQRWVTEMMSNVAYAKAQQDNTIFEFLGRDEANNNLPTKFIKDPTVYSIYKHIWGVMRDSCNDLPETVYANAISNEALKNKNLAANMAKMKIDFANEFNEMKDKGMDFMPMGNKEFSNEDELDKHMEETMQDAMSSFFTAFAKDFLYSQNWEEKCSKMAEYLIPAYFCRVGLEPKGKDVEWCVYRPAQCIWDNSFDDELGRRQRFQAMVETHSIPELLSVKDYKWEPAEILDIKAMATQVSANSNTIIQLNNMGGTTDLMWWQILSQTPVVTVVKAKWISFDEDTQSETWYEADLIGNKYVKNFKKCDNLTINKDGTINPPYLDFIPELTYGINYSIIGKMKQISDLITGLNARINVFVARAKGKIASIASNNMPTGTTQLSLLRQMASGLVYINKAKLDNPNDPETKKLIEIIDLTLSAGDVQGVRGEVIYWENKLRELASVPLVTLGQQTEIIGKSVQQQTIEQSTYGMLPLYSGFRLYINQILNVAAQMKKNIISTLDSPEELQFQVSPRQFEYFKVTKKDSLPDIQIYLSQKDQVTQADIAYIRDVAKNESLKPDTWFTALDAVQLLKFSTKTEMINYMESRERRWEMKKEMEAAAAAEAQAAQSTAANQAMEDTAEIQGENTLANTALKGKQDLQKEAFKAAMEEGAPVTE